jgi:hypothetical protein
VGVWIGFRLRNSDWVRKSGIGVRICFWLCQSRTIVVSTLALAAGVLLLLGCHSNGSGPPVATQKVPQPDINAVLRAHDNELMQIPGVVGVYVGLRADGKTPCLKVMAARITPAIRSKVPKSIEGYPVEIEETGVIRPLDSK